MANKKPKDFDPAATFPTEMWYYLQPPSGPEVKVSHALLEAALEALISTTKTNTQTISVPAGGYIKKMFVKASGAGNIKIESGSGLENVVPLTTFTSGESRLINCDYWNNTGSPTTLTVTAPVGVTVTIKYSQPIITI